MANQLRDATAFVELTIVLASARLLDEHIESLQDSSTDRDLVEVW